MPERVISNDRFNDELHFPKFFTFPIFLFFQEQKCFSKLDEICQDQRTILKSSNYYPKKPAIIMKKYIKMICNFPSAISSNSSLLNLLILVCFLAFLGTPPGAAGNPNFSKCPRPDEIAPCQCRTRGPTIQVR